VPGVDKDVHSKRSSVTQLWESEFRQPLREHVVKSKVAYLRPGISIHKYCPRENLCDSITPSFIYKRAFLAALFITATNWTQHPSSSTGECLTKWKCSHIVECHETPEKGKHYSHVSKNGCVLKTMLKEKKQDRKECIWYDSI